MPSQISHSEMKKKSHSSNSKDIPGILENPLSKVRMGILYWIPVAAISASGNVIFLFCFNAMAIAFISSLYGIRTHSFSRDLEILIWEGVMSGIPNSSISDTNETANSFSVYGIRRLSPSRRLIRMLVSAKKSIFTPYFFLILQPIQATLQRAKILFKRRFLLAFLQLRKCFFNLRPGGPLFYCDNHRSNILNTNL